MNWAKAAALVVFGASGALANTGLSTFHPQPRPADLTAAAAEPAGARNDLAKFRPMPRPDFAGGAAVVLEGVATSKLGHIRPLPRPVFAVAAAIVPRIRPQPRPDFKQFQPQVLLVAQPLQPTAPPQKPAKALQKGFVCQRADIKGKTLPPIRSAIKGCNVPDAVLVSQISGVVLNPPATINCEEAKALSVWVSKGLQPAFNNSILALNVVDSYACRPRNNVRGNPVSVHGLGQAIDISAFVTKSGRTYTVAQNYNAQIKAAQGSACGVFHTILGPGSDGFHENHIHFDVSHHGGRNYCH